MRLAVIGYAALALCISCYPLSPAIATTTGQIYLMCKPFADKSFKAENAKDLVCMTYFGSVRDTALTACRTLKSMEDPSTLEMQALIIRKLAMDYFAAGKLEDTNSAIQHFVNKIKDQPERWKFRADKAVLESIQAIAPCE